MAVGMRGWEEVEVSYRAHRADLVRLAGLLLDEPAMSDLERELRDSLRARAEAVPVGQADGSGLARRLNAARRRRRARVGGAALALLVGIGAVSVAARSHDDGPNVVAGPDPSSTTTSLTDLSTTTVPEPAPTTSAPTTSGPTTSGPAPSLSVPPAPRPTSPAPPPVARTTSTTAPPKPLPDDAIWPAPGAAASFPTPESAADDFARHFLAMGTAQLGPAQVTGTDATIDVRAFVTGGQVSVLALRRTPDRGWVVVGCAAPTIQVDAPSAGTRISSPLTVAGRVFVFEGQVDVEVRRDGAAAPIGRTTGTGGGTELMPFEATVSFARPPVARGTVVVIEARADVADQGPATATVVRIAF